MSFLRNINWTKPSTISLILVNLLIMVWAYVEQWEAFVIVFIFWIENLIIGIFNLIKMSFIKNLTLPGKDWKTESKTTFEKDEKDPNLNVRNGCIMGFMKIFVMVFFTIHYYGFCLVHGVFIVATLGGDSMFEGSANPNEYLTVEDWQQIGLASAGIFLSHGISFLVNFIRKKEYQDIPLMKMMFAPYRRIILVHVYIIAIAVLIAVLNVQSAILIFIFFIGKTILDLRQHHKEHEEAGEVQTEQ